LDLKISLKNWQEDLQPKEALVLWKLEGLLRAIIQALKELGIPYLSVRELPKGRVKSPMMIYIRIRITFLANAPANH